jgi:hypothetical protein
MKQDHEFRGENVTLGGIRRAHMVRGIPALRRKGGANQASA